MIGLAIDSGDSSEAEPGSPTQAWAPLAPEPPAPSIMSRVYGKLQRDGIVGFTQAVAQRVAGHNPAPREVPAPVTIETAEPIEEDKHLFHWKELELIDLLRAAKFTISKTHWQKAPFDMCIYLSATK